MRKRPDSRLHLLTVRPDSRRRGHSDEDGLILRVRGESATWVVRYTATSGKRREMGLGPAYRAGASQAGQSVLDARDAATKASSQLRQGIDPIDARALRNEEVRRVVAERRAAQAKHTAVGRSRVRQGTITSV